MSRKGFAYAIVQYSAKSPLRVTSDGQLRIYKRLRTARRNAFGYPILRVEIYGEDQLLAGGNGRPQKPEGA